MDYKVSDFSLNC